LGASPRSASGAWSISLFRDGEFDLVVWRDTVLVTRDTSLDAVFLTAELRERQTQEAATALAGALRPEDSTALQGALAADGPFAAKLPKVHRAGHFDRVDPAAWQPTIDDFEPGLRVEDGRLALPSQRRGRWHLLYLIEDGFVRGAATGAKYRSNSQRVWARRRVTSAGVDDGRVTSLAGAGVWSPRSAERRSRTFAGAGRSTSSRPRASSTWCRLARTLSASSFSPAKGRICCLPGLDLSRAPAGDTAGSPRDGRNGRRSDKAIPDRQGLELDAISHRDWPVEELPVRARSHYGRHEAAVRAALYGIATALEATIADLLGEALATQPTTNRPASLLKFARDRRLPEADVEMLASIRFRGESPKTPERCAYIYHSIRNSRAIDRARSSS
jgi:hypothetical protein